MVRKALGLMEIGPREATQGELQGELHYESFVGRTRAVMGRRQLSWLLSVVVHVALQLRSPIVSRCNSTTMKMMKMMMMMSSRR